MKFEKLIQKLHASKTYSEFSKKHKNAFLVAGFFVIDLESKNNMFQIDYYVPSENKIAAFSLASPITMQMLEMVKADTKPVPLSEQTNIDLDSLPGIIDDEMKNRSITEEIKKIVAILHTADGKTIWNVSCMLSGMSILKTHVEDKTESILKMERSSLFDIMKQVPGNKLQAQMQAQANANAEGKPQQAPQANVKLSKTAVKQALSEELEKLDKIEEQIEKEKTAIKAEMDKENKSESKTSSKKPSKKSK